MKGTKIITCFATLSGIVSTFMAHGEVSWKDEGIPYTRIATQPFRLGMNILLANPEIAGSVKAGREQLEKDFSRKRIPYKSLTPYTASALYLPLFESFKTTISWHPFYTRFLCNIDPTEFLEGCSVGDLTRFVDQKPTTATLTKRGTDLKFLAYNKEIFLPADQVAFSLTTPEYGKVAIALFADPKFLGGGTNDKESLFYMNMNQEERTFLCFPCLFAAAEASGVVRKVTWAGKDRNGNDVYEPFNREKTLKQGALPRYRYCQDGKDKDLAPGPEIIKREADGSLGFKATPKFSTFVIKGACMCFVSTTETFKGIRGKHGEAMCAYNPLEELIEVDLIFTATPEIPLNKMPLNTFLSVEYLKALIEDLKTQMAALEETETNTFITGPIGCEVFGNDMRAVALAYAYVLMYHKPEKLENIAITNINFYNMLKRYWERIDAIEPIAGKPEENFIEQIFDTTIPPEERQFHIFHKVLKDSVPLCPANSDLAQAFAKLSSVKRKKGLRKVSVLPEHYQRLMKTRGFDFCVNQNGQFLSELIEVKK